MKKGIYVVAKNMETEKNTDPGVCKKIYAQIEELSKYYEINLVEAYYKNSYVKKALSRLPFFPNLFQIDYSKIDLPLDFIYFRLNMGDRQTIRFFKWLKIKNPSCKIIVEFPDYPVDWKRFLKKWHQRTFISKHKWCERHLSKYVDRIVLFNNYEEVCGVKTIVTDNGVNTEKVLLRKIESTEDDTINVISVSTMLTWQGIDRFLEGMGKYYQNEKNPRSIVLHLVGDGQSRQDYEKIVEKYSLQEHVIFYGMQFSEGLERVYDKCDIALGELARHRTQTEQKRSTSIKIREYWAKGMPIIGAANFDKQMIDSIGDYILRVPDDESDIDMLKVIEFFDSVYPVFDSDTRRKVAEQIREYAVENCSFKKTISPIRDYIEGK